VQGNSYVRKVLFVGTRAVGVEVRHAGVVSTIEANEVVLSASAVKTPHILLLSGLGPATELKRFGIPVIKDLPGVGRDFSDHPNLTITWRPRIPLIDYSMAQAMADVLNITANGSSCIGDLEIINKAGPPDNRRPGLEDRLADVGVGDADVLGGGVFGDAFGAAFAAES
jgi:choline dehydrogenase-like flavoprotein